MKALILGGAGMLGHQLVRVLSQQMPVAATFRDPSSLARLRDVVGSPANASFLTGVDAAHEPQVREALDAAQPTVVLNAIGVVKQSDAIGQAAETVRLNALLPHQLAALCAARGIRLIHFSTDCVFSGRRGHYAEADTPDPVDFYGRSKLLGEVEGPGCLTLRTSIVGWELAHHRSLLGWFASQRGGRIQGYSRAIFSGLSTEQLALLARRIVVDEPTLCGIYHAASAPISKFELLVALRDALGWTMRIDPESDFACDRSLDASRLTAATGWTAPPWAQMIEELAAEWPAYQQGAKA